LGCGRGGILNNFQFPISNFQFLISNFQFPKITNYELGKSGRKNCGKKWELGVVGEGSFLVV